MNTKISLEEKKKLDYSIFVFIVHSQKISSAHHKINTHSKALRKNG